MSKGLRFTMADYRNMVTMSSKKRLLVEGPSDKRVFTMLFRYLGVSNTSVDIDAAELLIDLGNEPKGNGEKVEAVCRSIASHPFSDRLAGFVDREYREFTHDTDLSDRLGKHAIDGRIVYSRGHSIENYFFSSEILKEPLRTFSVTEHFDSALDLFDTVVLQALSIACAIGLSARDNGLLRPVRDSLRWDLFGVSDRILSFDHARWARSLSDRIRLDTQRVDSLMDSFSTWSPIARRSDPEVIRWMCDGHLGLSAIWAVYGACVAAVCAESGSPDIHREVVRVLKAEESVRFNACAESWARRAPASAALYPLEVLVLLGLHRGQPCA
jgi:hypothetical protein